MRVSSFSRFFFFLLSFCSVFLELLLDALMRRSCACQLLVALPRETTRFSCMQKSFVPWIGWDTVVIFCYFLALLIMN